MISEKTFAAGFTSFWKEVLPGTQSYMKLVKAGLNASVHTRLDAPARKQNTAIVNVLAFNYYRLSIERKLDLAPMDSITLQASTDYGNLMTAATEYMDRFAIRQTYVLPLTAEEVQQALEVAQRLTKRYHWSQNPIVDPKFDGCGIIDATAGDIFVDRKLIEIKAGVSDFEPAYLRQVMIYCTLNHYSSIPFPAKRVEIFNPRSGELYQEDVEQLALMLSGTSSLELFSTIQKYITEFNFVECPNT